MGAGQDCLAEHDHRVGQLLDAVDDLGIRDDTIVVYMSDNGPEMQHPYNGSAGPWRGSYFTTLEGSLRVPTIVRWPGHVLAGTTSNELVHEVDMFVTLLRWAGTEEPTDRIIDGVDQRGFFEGRGSSSRDGFPVYLNDRLQAVKWRKYKVHFYDPAAETGFDSQTPAPTPHVFDLLRDQREEHNIVWTHTWVLHPVYALVNDHLLSLRREPPIAPGTPDPYSPPAALVEHPRGTA